MHGITLTDRPADWTVLQQESGRACVTLRGAFRVHPAAIQVGVAWVRPVWRLVSEDDNSVIIPWTALRCQVNEDFTGHFEDTISLPAGGLYRLDTSLETHSTTPRLVWLYRGDCVLHLGVGNVFVIAGQSNSAGYGRDYAMDPPEVGVHLFRNRSCWDLACHPMNESTDAGSLANEEMGVPGVSPYLAFGKALRRMTHLPVGLVQTALGGSPMSRWHPETGDLYRNMLDKLALTGGKYAGVLWYQGCSDGDPAAAPDYLMHFRDMVDALRAHLGYDIPFYTFQLNRFLDSREDVSWGQVREAQRQAALTMKHVHILPTTNCAMSDGIHNSAHANMLLGEKLARQVAHELIGAPAYEAPSIASAVLEADGRVCLSFDRAGIFVVHSGAPAQCGFTVEDDAGTIPLTAFQCTRDDENRMYLTPERTPGEGAVVSFAWEADPIRFPPEDEVTYLPPLSFYRYPITKA